MFRCEVLLPVGGVRGGSEAEQHFYLLEVASTLFR